MNYYGMTIGPIVETISGTSKPAGLWMASYFFSTITRDLCIKFASKSNVTIVSPYFFKEDAKKQDGIGRYNDRIILQVDEDGDFLFENKLKKIIDEIKYDKGEQIAACLPNENKDDVVNYIKNYIYVQYICIPPTEIKNNNVLESVSTKLDALELMQFTPTNGKPYLQMIFEDNDLIRRYDEFPGARSFLEDSKFNIKNIENIAATQSDEWLRESKEDKKNLKFRKYFAVVYADGDHMGTVVKQLGKDSLEKSIEAQNNFSKKCLEYTSNSAEKIMKFGGVPIYAGGDDLLFLAPLIGKNGYTILRLCDEISDDFNRVFKKEEKASASKETTQEETSTDSSKEKTTGAESNERERLGDNDPSLSYGISINYYKFPLYEAVNDARRLLFVEAKSGLSKKEFLELKEEEKKDKYPRIYNSIALRLRKASGQSEELVMKQGDATMASLEKLLTNDFLSTTMKDDNTSTDQGNEYLENKIMIEDKYQTLHGTIFTIEKFSYFIEQLWSDEQKQITKENRQKVFKNFFDNVHQDKAGKWLSSVVELGNAVDEDLKTKSLRIKISKYETEEENSSEVEISEKALPISGSIATILRLCKFFVEKKGED